MNLETQKHRNIGTTRSGFTLIEMLVVFGIIAILVGASLASYSKMTKTADKTKVQELVHQTATALAAIYEADGIWPKRIRDVNADEENGRVDEKVALILAKRGYMSLSGNAKEPRDFTKLVGRDRYGILTPWAAKKVENKNASLPDKYIKENTLQFAVDLNGDGIIKAEECGNRTEEMEIRATVVVWCPSKDGKGKVTSWTKGQARKVQ